LPTSRRTPAQIAPDGSLPVYCSVLQQHLCVVGSFIGEPGCGLRRNLEKKRTLPFLMGLSLSRICLEGSLREGDEYRPQSGCRQGVGRKLWKSIPFMSKSASVLGLAYGQRGDFRKPSGRCRHRIELLASPLQGPESSTTRRLQVNMVTRQSCLRFIRVPARCRVVLDYIN
jgi:hypothetical protein